MQKKNIITLKGEKSEEDIVTGGMRTGYIVLHWKIQSIKFREINQGQNRS